LGNVTDRRRAKRIAVNIEVVVSVMDNAPGSVVQANPAESNIERVVFTTQGSGEFFDADMLDISTNGARLSSELQPPLLSRVSLAFNFEELRYVHATALVMWRTRTPASDGKYGFGVLFEAIPVDVRVRIEKAITTKAS
jgi:hypothetical protein